MTDGYLCDRWIPLLTMTSLSAIYKIDSLIRRSAAGNGAYDDDEDDEEVVIVEDGEGQENVGPDAKRRKK